MANPIPYKGDKGYIFISYAHRDAQLVLPIVEQMQQDGYRVWYDEGIDPGTEWDEFIASHVMGCGFFIAFMSRNYLRSENCKDELNFARDLKKPQVLVYLEKVQLPRGIELRVGRCESFSADPNGNFLKKLYKAEGIRDFYEGATQNTKRSPLLWIIPVALAAALSIGAALLPKNEPEPTEAPPETTTAQMETTTETAANTQLPVIDMNNLLLVEENGVRINGCSLGFNEEGNLNFTFHMENTSDRENFISLSGFHLNSFPSLGSNGWELPAGQSMDVTVSWTPRDLERAGIVNIASIEDIQYLQGSFYIYGIPATFFFSPHGEAPAAEYPMHESDQILLDNGRYQVVLRESTYTSDNDWILDLAYVNTANKSVVFTTTIDSINGYALSFVNCETAVLPGGWMLDRVKVDDWTFLEELCIEKALLNIRITHGENYNGLLEETVLLYPEENTDFVPTDRQLTENDLLLLENEYVRLAVLSPELDGSDYLAYAFYAKNLSDQPLRFTIEGEVYNMSLGDLVRPGYQVHRSDGRSFDDSADRTVTFTLVIRDESYTELFRQTFEFDASAYEN